MWLWLSNITPPSLQVTCTRPGQVFRRLCSIRRGLLQLHLHCGSKTDNRRRSVFTSNFDRELCSAVTQCQTPCPLTDALAINCHPDLSLRTGERMIAERAGATSRGLWSESDCQTRRRLQPWEAIRATPAARVRVTRPIAIGVPLQQSFHG